MFIDIHTHRPAAEPGTVGIVNAADFSAANGLFSIGIHPWKTCENVDMVIVNSLAGSAFAIGECGLDKLRGADMATQMNVFRQHISLADKLQKPLIIHCVKSYGLILQENIDSRSVVPWMMHGCNASPEWIRSASKRNFYFSLGLRQLNSAKTEMLLKSIPSDRLFFETDDENVSISEVYARAAQIMHVPCDELCRQIETTFGRLRALHAHNSKN